MASKLQIITEWSKATAHRITDNHVNWTAFLSTAAWNYKYKFQEQLMIYAQKPEATACASIELWNKLGRWVNKGAKGIALIDDNDSTLKLRHVFDVSDTNGRYEHSIQPWRMADQYENSIIEALENSFGDLGDKLSLVSALVSATHNAVDDNFSDYYTNLLDVREDSFLEELDELNVEVVFKNALESSLSYMLLTRCGIDANKYFSFEDFKSVLNFNTPETMSVLGDATSDIAEMALREICQTIKNLKKAEKFRIRTFAEKQDSAYNYDKNTAERSFDYGTDLYNAGRLSDPRPDAADRNDNREIWDAAQNLPQKPQEGDLHRADALGQADESSDGNRADSDGANRTDRVADGEITERNRGNESNKSDGLGWLDEQYQTLGGGNRASGTDLQLAVYNRETEDKSLPFFHSNIVINEILRTTPHLKAAKQAIADFFAAHEDDSERVAYIKSIFNNDYTELMISNNLLVGYKTYQNVLHLWEGSYSNRTAQGYYDWGVIQQHISGMILLDEFYDGSKLLPTVVQQLALIDQAEEKTAGFSFSQEVIDTVLQRGSGTHDGKLRIYRKFQKHEPAKQNENFLRAEYGWGGSCPVISGTDIDESHDGKGIKISRGDTIVILSWSKVAKRIDELIAIDRYLSETDKANLLAYENRIAEHGQQTEENDEGIIADSMVTFAEQAYEESQKELKESLVGETIMMDDREFYIDSVDEELGTASLADITFQKGVGFPIYRKESIGFVRGLLAEKENEPVMPAWEKPKPKNHLQTFDLHPEVPAADRHNFHITNDELGYGSAKEKAGNNFSAIKLLKQLENEHRFAVPEEQEILSRYVGWGGLSQAFDDQNTAWTNEYLELKTLLDETEYSAARESTLTAFYTSPVVIRAMYKAIENMGFKDGNILEPSCGTGNFLGMLPDSMQSSKLYGVELDSITGRIAQQLYQNSSIAVLGYEKTNLPDSFFDLAIGNVPFGQFKVADKRYDKYSFLIHDYFFAKTLDKVRPGGIIAFITSKGTMDKENIAVRKYIAQRADLLGAVRLPNNAFKANAGTEVTADIIFLQKRDRILDIDPEWVHLGTDENGIVMNSYFRDNPGMILGEMVMESTQHGMDSTCKAYEDTSLERVLEDAMSNIHAEITEYEVDELSDDEVLSIPADPTVRNFSYTRIDSQIYFRENSRMMPVELSITAANRIKGMIEIRDCVRSLIEYQTEDYPEEDIKREQAKLNQLYDAFTHKYDLINSRANNTAFGDDSSYCLLCSLEVIDENGELARKADMFTKRTIKPHTTVTSVDTASEALAISISERACVDMAFMQGLAGKTSDVLEKELEGVIFRIPNLGDEKNPHFEAADEYLSGNVREKLKAAKAAAQVSDSYGSNVKALEAVQPKDLNASEISVRLGATWLPPEVVQDFMFELLGTPRYAQWNIKVHYSDFTAGWSIEAKSYDRSNIKAYSTYGTSRMNAYKIIEETLNLKDVRIFDSVENADGKKTQVLNKKETIIVQQKQELIKSQFSEWIWSDPARREELCRLYNDKFNSIRPREYDGRHITFVGITPEITLRPHQVNAIAHILYGGNTLLAHVVGAGKTFEMVAAAMESKRLGLCHKSLFVVPNHLTEQWASEFLQLYPSANLLVATKKDFETQNRKKFCGRIATGDYDAVIIGHSQFEKIPMSIERQQAILQQQLDEITEGIADLKHNRGENFSIKQLEKTKKTIRLKLDKLNDQTRKDDVVTFEELGVDRLFVDEAHYYKNLFLYTKMRNVGGIAQTEAQKSSDLFMKCRYLDELTAVRSGSGRGVVFATGTPISNSMTELYTMQRYLQYETLVRSGLQHFDAWASTFGETVTAIELAPEGTGYRAKTRFAKFYNLPELMAMFKEVADIQTADMLALPVPKANYHNVVIKPSEQQVEMVLGLAKRADRVRNKMVDASVDNMLLITNDGRKLALDQRLANELLPDFENSKVATCAYNIFEVWNGTRGSRLTQLVFCDLSTPHGDDKFNVYDDIRNKLIATGVPTEEIAFIHEANSDVQKKEMFAKVRNGKIRVLFGSTQKMGTGTNVQDRLVALHDLDCPWRPSDLEQRSGRILRQGNTNLEVGIYRYVTEQTFDAYLYQLVENKQKFIAQVMTSKSPVRSAEDIDETALSYAEIKALATGNPFIKEKMDLDISVSKLRLLKGSHLSQRYALEDRLIKLFPQEIKQLEERIAGYNADRKQLAAHTPADKEQFPPMTVNGVTCFEKAEAGKALIEACRQMQSPDAVSVGEYRGFSMELSFDTFSKEYHITLRNELRHTVSLGTDIHGNISRIDNALEAFPVRLHTCEEQLENTKTQMETAKNEIARPFQQEEELKQKTARLDELNILLNMDQKDNQLLDSEPSEDIPEELQKAVGWER